MIALARQFGAAAKFSGSGGAIVGLLLDQSKKLKMAESFQKNGFVYIGMYFYHYATKKFSLRNYYVIYSDLNPNYPPTDEEKNMECIAGTEL